MYFLLFSPLYSFSYERSQLLFPNLLLEVGGTNATLGFAGSVNAIVEIPFSSLPKDWAGG